MSLERASFTLIQYFCSVECCQFKPHIMTGARFGSLYRWVVSGLVAVLLVSEVVTVRWMAPRVAVGWHLPLVAEKVQCHLAKGRAHPGASPGFPVRFAVVCSVRWRTCGDIFALTPVKSLTRARTAPTGRRWRAAWSDMRELSTGQPMPHRVC